MMMPPTTSLFEDDVEEKQSFKSGSTISSHSLATSMKNANSESAVPNKPTESTLFGDKDCGEPLKTQHITFDFKADHGIDTEESINKCYEFWEFIHNEPRFRDLMVIPDTAGKAHHTPETNARTTSCDSEPTEKTSERAAKAERTAVSVLSFVEKQGLIDRIFEAKLPITYCPLDVPNYVDHKFGSLDDPVKLTHTKACHCVMACNCKIKQKPEDFGISCSDKKHLVEGLNKEMVKWDQEHPKSFEPPGRTPKLCRCVQRKAIA